jgi:hypothetical protein
MSDPELVVRLKTDAAGRPAALTGRNHQHYRVEFEVRNPPPDTYAATFELHPSYPDPVRTLPPDSEGRFRLSTTTYGDYPVVVRLRTRTGDEVVVRETVARALRRSPSSTPALKAAVDYIAAH